LQNKRPAEDQLDGTHEQQKRSRIDPSLTVDHAVEENDGFIDRELEDAPMASIHTIEDTAEQSESVPPAEYVLQRTIEFSEVFQDGNPEFKHVITQFPRDTGRWYIFRCDHHKRHFGENPIQGAALHLSRKHGKTPRGDQHGLVKKGYARAVEELGIEVLNCNEDLAEKNNDMFRKAYNDEGYGPLGGLKSYGTRPHPPPRASFGGGPTDRHHQDQAGADAPHPQESRRQRGNYYGILDPKPGQLYLAYWHKSGKSFAVLMLPFGSFANVGLPGCFEDSGLLNKVPPCYRYNKLEKKILGWEDGYNDGEQYVAEREFPVIFFDKPDFPTRRSNCWIPAKDLKEFDPTQNNPDLPFRENVYQFLQNQERNKSHMQSEIQVAPQIIPREDERPLDTNSSQQQIDIEQQDAPSSSQSPTLSTQETVAANIASEQRSPLDSITAQVNKGSPSHGSSHLSAPNPPTEIIQPLPSSTSGRAIPDMLGIFIDLCTPEGSVDSPIDTQHTHEALDDEAHKAETNSPTAQHAEKGDTSSHTADICQLPNQPSPTTAITETSRSSENEIHLAQEPGPTPVPTQGSHQSPHISTRKTMVEASNPMPLGLGGQNVSSTESLRSPQPGPIQSTRPVDHTRLSPTLCQPTSSVASHSVETTITNPPCPPDASIPRQEPTATHEATSTANHQPQSTSVPQPFLRCACGRKKTDPNAWTTHRLRCSALREAKYRELLNLLVCLGQESIPGNLIFGATYPRFSTRNGNELSDSIFTLPSFITDEDNLNEMMANLINEGTLLCSDGYPAWSGGDSTPKWATQNIKLVDDGHEFILARLKLNQGLKKNTYDYWRFEAAKLIFHSFSVPSDTLWVCPLLELCQGTKQNRGTTTYRIDQLVFVKDLLDDPIRLQLAAPEQVQREIDVFLSAAFYCTEPTKSRLVDAASRLSRHYIPTRPFEVHKAKIYRALA
jgi:hypothetical protein